VLNKFTAGMAVVAQGTTDKYTGIFALGKGWRAIIKVFREEVAEMSTYLRFPPWPRM